jgi:hypothetical protein
MFSSDLIIIIIINYYYYFIFNYIRYSNFAIGDIINFIDYITNLTVNDDYYISVNY